MKKTIILPILVFLVSLNFYGQVRGQSHEKIKSARIGYISSELTLNSEQAQKFWPIYNTFSDSIYALDREKRKIERNIDYDYISEEKAKEYILLLREKENKTIRLKDEFYLAITKVISQKQFLKLNRAEHQFKKQLLQRIRRRN